MISALRSAVLRTFFKGYNISFSVPYGPKKALYVVFDLGRVIADEPDAFEIDVIDTSGVIN